jgi:hypothetical protein
VLVAERVSQFQAGAHRDLGCDMCQAVQVDDHYLAQAYPHRDASRLARFPDQYVAVAHDRPTIKRDGKLGSFGSLFPKAIFLCLPLIQFKNIDAGIGQSLRPFAIVDVADNCFNDDHGKLTS